MAWIKTNKDKHRDRKYELEDREYYEKQNGGITMDDKKTEVTEEITEFPTQDTFNSEDMTPEDDKEAE